MPIKFYELQQTKPNREKKSMTKDDLARGVARTLDTTVTEGHRVTDAVFGAMKDTLRNGEPISIRKFGSWFVRPRSERLARNPKTGEPAMIPAGKKIMFKASKIFKSEVDR